MVRYAASSGMSGLVSLSNHSPTKIGFVIPVYRHGGTAAAVVRALLPFGLPVILVDDGNDAENRALIDLAAGGSTQVTVVTRRKNGGKGAAVTSGAMKARQMGLTHIFQLDSDGQHDTSAVPKFLAAAKAHPQCVICGYPQYDGTVPASRKSGREVSNTYARFLSVNHEVKDVVCGFRVYPLEPLVRMLHWHPLIDKRMGYDVEVMVRLVWMGVHVINMPVRVTYPADGISNFHMVRDNVRISLVFTSLSFGLLWRFPMLYYRKKRQERIDNKKAAPLPVIAMASPEAAVPQVDGTVVLSARSARARPARLI